MENAQQKEEVQRPVSPSMIKILHLYLIFQIEFNVTHRSGDIDLLHLESSTDLLSVLTQEHFVVSTYAPFPLKMSKPGLNMPKIFTVIC